MKIESVSYSMSPERVTTDSFDFLWLILKPRSESSPLASASLQWIDWRLRGRLSRYLRSNPDIGKTPVYFAASEHIATPMVAVVSGDSADWGAILKASQGIQAKTVGIFLEDPGMAQSAKNGLQKHSSSGLAERVTLAFDA